MNATTLHTDALARAAGVGSLLLLSALTGCHDSGGRARTPGTVGPPAGSVLNVDFGLRRDISLGSAFIGDVLHVDLNGDGVGDLVETNFLPQEITIALGNPDGTFTTLLSRSTAGYAWRLAHGDLDGNGMPDIVVASQEFQGAGERSVEVFLQGPSPAEFSLPVVRRTLPKDPIDLVTQPASGVAGDAGPDEVYVAVRREFRVLRLGLSGNALIETGSLSSGALGTAGGPFSIASIDLGGDGLLDLVVGEDEVPGLDDRVVAYPRTGAGFGAAQLVMAPLFSPIVDNVGDADANSYEDIAVAQIGSNDVYLLRGDAAGLSMATALDFGGATSSVIFPDLDGDGLAEAVATTVLQGSVQVLPGTGPMAWGDPVHYNVGSIPRAIDTILLPGDEIPDLLCGNARDLSVLVGVGQGRFRGAIGYSTGSDAPSIVELADLDNDGDLDAVTVSRQQRSISFLRGSDDGTLVPLRVLPLMPTLDDQPGDVNLADMDGDGDLDVLTTVIALDELRLYRNPTNIDGFVDPSMADVFATDGGPIGFDVADLDGDTVPDVVVANSTTGTLQVLLNDGTGALTSLPSVVLGIEPRGVYAMDFDVDGDVDVAVLGEDPAGFHVQILAGDNTGALALDESHQIDGPSDSMVAGDFNGDERPDIVVGQTEAAGDEIFLLMNQGEGFNYDARRVQVSPGPSAVNVADLNNDQHLDIVVATTQGELVVLLGDGEGGFPTRVPGAAGELPIAHYTISAKLGDMNGDDLPDLVNVSTQTPFVWIGLNTSTPVSQP